MRYSHGGAPCLRTGGQILPPDQTGTDRTLSQYITDADQAPHAQRRDVVYLTTSRNVARAFAAFYPDGALYQAEPQSDVKPDPDCGLEGLSWHCRSALVVAVIDPVVLFRTRTPERWLRLMVPALE